jgi:glycosyltransferase involved in cell wall biosynthesis
VKPGLGLTVLQVGPLYNNHVRRWSSQAAALGCSVHAAGHTRPGRRRADLTGVVGRAYVAPEGLTELDDAAQVDWLRGVIRAVQPDLIHAHWLPGWAHISARAGERPLIVTAWGSDLYLMTGAQRRRADFAMHNADCVLARSEHMRGAMLARGVANDRIRRVDLGVDLGRFRPQSASQRARIRAELALPRGPVILSARAGAALYRLDVVLEAFRIVRRSVPDATLVLVRGDAPLCGRARELLEELERAGGVRDMGHVAHREIPKYVGAATVAVSIPSSDGSPSSVWEALACGVPVVLSNLPQIEEKVGRSGAVAVIEPRAPEVASALLELIGDPGRHRRMARAARSWAVANVDQRLEGVRLGAVYRALGNADALVSRRYSVSSRAPAASQFNPDDTATRPRSPIASASAGCVSRYSIA